MSSIQDDDEKPLDPAAAAIVAKVRKMTMISGLITAIGIGAIFAVIGYRVFKSEGSSPAAMVEAKANLPANARVLGTSIGGERIAITIDVGGKVEIRTFDVKTLQPVGRLMVTGP
ncbi:MAG: hypothetical protein JWN71_3951 [Xanthobacteraceae bacterium]|jgi:hypothetical protein|nr:hypothetical protein [Xanthobacteraceae bacterium]